MVSDVDVPYQWFTEKAGDYCMAFSVTGNPLVLQTATNTPAITLTPGLASLTGNVAFPNATVAGNISAANVTATNVTATTGVTTGSLTAGSATVNNALTAGSVAVAGVSGIPLTTIGTQITTSTITSNLRAVGTYLTFAVVNNAFGPVGARVLLQHVCDGATAESCIYDVTAVPGVTGGNPQIVLPVQSTYGTGSDTWQLHVVDPATGYNGDYCEFRVALAALGGTAVYSANYKLNISFTTLSRALTSTAVSNGTYTTYPTATYNTQGAYNTLNVASSLSAATVTANTITANVLTANTLQGNLTGATVAAGTVTASANVNANLLTSAFTLAQGGANATAVSSLALPLAGDHSQIWCKVTSNTAFTASLLAGGDSNASNYTLGLVTVTANASAGIATSPLTQFGNGAVLMANCAANALHSIAVRAVNPTGVFDVDVSGTTAGGVYRTTGAVLYTGTTPTSAQITFTPSVTSARYGVQQVLYA